MRDKKVKTKRDKSMQWHKTQKRYYKNILTGIKELKSTILDKLDQVNNVHTINKRDTQVSKQTPQKIHFCQQEQRYNYLVTPKTKRYSSKEWTPISISKNAMEIMETPKHCKQKQVVLMTPVKKAQISLLKPYNSFYTPQNTKPSLQKITKTPKDQIQRNNLLKTILFNHQNQEEIYQSRKPTNIKMKIQRLQSIQNCNYSKESTILIQSNRNYKHDSQPTSRQLETCRAFSINYKCDKQNTKTTETEHKTKSNLIKQNIKITDSPHYNIDSIKQKLQNNPKCSPHQQQNSIQAHYDKQITKLQMQNLIGILEEQFQFCLKQTMQAKNKQRAGLAERMRVICCDIMELQQMKSQF